MFYALYIANKTDRFSFKNGCDVRVAEHLVVNTEMTVIKLVMAGIQVWLG